MKDYKFNKSTKLCAISNINLERTIIGYETRDNVLHYEVQAPSGVILFLDKEYIEQEYEDKKYLQKKQPSLFRQFK